MIPVVDPGANPTSHTISSVVVVGVRVMAAKSGDAIKGMLLGEEVHEHVVAVAEATVIGFVDPPGVPTLLS